MILHTQHTEMPGLVVAHHVEVGDMVGEGDLVMVLETMKCESPVRAGCSGRISWMPDVGAVVPDGSVLLRIEERSAVRTPTPDELIETLCGRGSDRRLDGFTEGSVFTELDLDPDNPERLVKASGLAEDRKAAVVVGRISHRLSPHPAPVERIWVCGDSTKALGAVAEAECRRIIAAIDLAEEEGLTLEWVTVSSGARISMNSGTENMDWCAAVVRRLVEFTQGGGEVVIVVAGINVGAQSYWNAEATMLMHCAGLLVMVEGTSMVLTGRRALAQAGGVSESTDHDLGGTGIMSGNGQAHHRCDDLVSAFEVILTHHALCNTAVAPRRAETTDSADRDVCADPYLGAEPASGAIATVGEILHHGQNPERLRAFDIEAVMHAVIDRDAPQLRRWVDMVGASGACVWDTRIDGWPVSLMGIDSRPRLVDGKWEAAGTLYPQASRKIARALNHASGRRPAVMLANLAGFDGSQDSLFNIQLEHGAELARAVVNFQGPLVVVVIGRFHGGAYVVLNKQLNPNVHIIAVDGTKVSVIGGSAAAEVVLRKEVRAVEEEMRALPQPPPDPHRAAVREVARRFDAVHDVHRAKAVGSVDEVIDASEIRPAIASVLAERVHVTRNGEGHRGSPRSRGVINLRNRGRQPAGRT